MKKLSEKQGEKLPSDNDPSMKWCRSRDATSWEGAEDAQNDELSFRTLENEMTSSELCMLWVDSTLQHESVKWLWGKERSNGRGVGISTQRVTLSSTGSPSLFRMVRDGFLEFEDESTNEPWWMKKNKSAAKRLSEGVSCEESNLQEETILHLKSRPHFAI